ncbi:MAG: transglutaminase domain-containing protein [Lachnospiraceae bacterium]|nr:transglutaminase domain-containing protein [Lachnospiraceae bacterium]
MKEKQKIVVLWDRREKHSNTVSSMILKTVGAMGITVGVMMVFFVLGGIPVFFMPVCGALFSVAVITGIDTVSKGRHYGSVLCLLLSAFLFFLFVSNVLRCIYGWTSHIRHIWNQVFGTFYEESLSVGYGERDLQITGVILALFLSSAICELQRRKYFVLLSSVVFVPLCLSLLLCLALPFWVIAVLMAGWLMAWCGMSGPFKVRLESLVLVVFSAICLYAFSAVWDGSLWQQNSAKFRSGVKAGIEKIRFGEDTLPEGNLLKADRMLAGEDERLELETETESPLYLRGFVGSVYEENRWKPFPAEVYGGEFAGMLSWLSGQDFYPGMQYADYENASPEEGKTERRVSVKNVGASRRYIYLPETVSALSEASGGWKQDWSMEASGWFGEREYGFTYYDTQEGAEIQVPGEWIYQDIKRDGEAGAFLQAEQVYRSFVYKNYLELEEGQKELINQVFFQGDDWEGAKELYTVTSRIRTVLCILAKYQEIPEKVPENKEFLTWFLKEGKEGNSAYYASAAVLAYRAAGIPARYAEGYLLTEKQAGQMEGNTVTLSGKNVHAWVEVYMDGMGWRVMEVTPGFYEEVYEADIVVAVPDEELDGTNGELPGVSATEEYEPPAREEEELSVPLRKKTRLFHPVVLLIFVVFFLVKSMKLTRGLYLRWRYRRMREEVRMDFLYCKIMDMMRKMYKEFHSDQPLKILEKEDLPFDRDLYERTVKRMEKLVYGQINPTAREVLAAEALATQVYTAFRRKRTFRKTQKVV